MTVQVGDSVTLRPDYGDGGETIVTVVGFRGRVLLIKEVKPDGTGWGREGVEYKCDKDWWRILQLTEARQQREVGRCQRS